MRQTRELSKDPDEALAYWYQRVDRMRNVIRKRPTLLWEYVQESFQLSTEEMEGFFGPKPEFPPEALF